MLSVPPKGQLRCTAGGDSLVAHPRGCRPRSGICRRMPGRRKPTLSAAVTHTIVQPWCNARPPARSRIRPGRTSSRTPRAASSTWARRPRSGSGSRDADRSHKHAGHERPHLAGHPVPRGTHRARRCAPPGAALTQSAAGLRNGINQDGREREQGFGPAPFFDCIARLCAMTPSRSYRDRRRGRGASGQRAWADLVIRALLTRS